MKHVILLCLLSLIGSMEMIQAQVLDPNDPVVTYDPANPPATPPYGTLAKWVRTKRVNWNTDNFKSYYFNGMVFRLRFPNNYDPSGNTKYPLIVMLAGRGESGDIYDNENNLKHGARDHEDAVNDGDYNGFLFFPQSINGYWGEGYRSIINTLINNHFSAIHVDKDRVIIHGLSSGGQAVWEFISEYPNTIAAALPMSAASTLYYSGINRYKHLPIWLSQGGKDTAPTPFTSSNLVDEIVSNGGNIRYTIYKEQGHGVWNTHYNESDFWPFINRAHKTVPVVMNGELTLISTSSTKDVYEFLTKEELCPGENIQVRLGLTAGFQAYQWRRNGTVISGATSNEYVATQYGVYEARFQRNGEWSQWSERAVEVKEKAATVTPDIQVSGLASRVLPSPDGKTTVDLELPEGYIAYAWRRNNTTPILSTNRIFAAGPGEYVATVTEQFGCSSSFSSPFKVIDANGNNAPPALSSAAGFALSKTSVQLQWAKVPNAPYPATSFEIYRSTVSGSEYSLISMVDANTSQYTDNNLQANTHYYYILRPVNQNGAAPVSGEVVVKTEVDNNPPTAPLNLRVASSGPTQIQLSWDEATDDVEVYRYDVYRNGVKSVVAETNSATIFNLQEGQIYRFQVKARDLTGNESPFSNQLVAAAVSSGLTYKYYHGNWSSLPNFNALTPVKTGLSDNVDISVRERNDNFGFLWEGLINIPVAGTYKFETYSDDGSKLYIATSGSAYNESNLVVNNDGAHGNRYRAGNYTFNSAGSYPIAITFFEAGGGENMQVFWTRPGQNSREGIPDNAFKDEVNLPGPPPAFPTQVVANAVSYNSIDISWTDNSNNENNFQIYRAENPAGPFLPVAMTNANVTTYRDTNLHAETTYYYRVMALNNNGDSGFSDEILTGLAYSYYEGSFSNLGQLNNATPKKEGSINNFSLSPRDRNNNIAFKYVGKINLASTGQYTFYTESDDGSELFINGSRIVNNDFNQGMTERSGNVTLSQGIHDIEVRWRQGSGGYGLNVRYAGPNINKQIIPDAALRSEDINATTLALPPAPNAPANIVAEALSVNEIRLSWNKVNNAEGYTIYRSIDNNQNFLPVDEISNENAPANIVYLDKDLYPHTNYFYQIEAYNVGGKTSSAPFAISTQNNIPVLDDIQDLTIRYGVEFDLQLYGSDEDEDALTITGLNLPSFATLTDYGDGSGLLKLNPTAADQGTYNGINIRLSDNFGGQASSTFDLQVNDNFLPELSPISDINLSEGSSTSITLSATDNEGAENLSWSGTLPSFASLEVNADGTADLILSPGYTDSGTYPSSITVEDTDGGTSTQNFIITISGENPNTIVQVNFTDGSLLGGVSWNNTSGHPTQGASYQNLSDINSSTTGFGITISSNWNNLGSNLLGSNTGNNSGIYPDNVIRSSYWTDAGIRTITINGLNDSRSYNLTFFGSRAANDDRSTRYSSGGQSVVLNTASNTSQTVKISNLTPTNGEISFTMERAGGSQFGYLNALVIEEQFDTGEAPAVPTDLTASFDVSENRVVLNWNDRAFDEVGYRVYRATQESGPFGEIAELVGGNISAYNDTEVSANTTYYYQVGAYNGNGESLAAPISITVPNIAPFITALDDLTIEIGDMSTVDVVATDDVGDQISLSVTGLPAFATFSDTGNGTGTISINPQAGSLGEYIVNVTAEDQHGGTITESFTIIVIPSGLSTYYINFAGTNAYIAPSPWNNYVGVGNSGDVLNNITSQGGEGSVLSMRLQDNWSGNNALGMTGSSLYPDNVTRTSLWMSDAQNKRILISGLSTENAYNFTFFASRSGTGNRFTEYSINGVKVSLNASNNQNQTVSIEGVIPNSNGELLITVNKAADASYGYINALVIEGYQAAAIPAIPTDLVATPVNSSSINLNWQDNTNLETGYEVWRSTTAGTGYALLATTSAGATGYTDSGLDRGITYYYVVRANLTDGSQTDFSNEAGASTINATVSINFNFSNPEASPWNNTNSLPDPGLIFSNLLNENGNNTGISFEIVAENPAYDPSLYGFSGDNPFGKITGDNSGVVPDNVMRSTWWMDPGKTAELRFFGMDLSQSYNFTFFASRDGTGNRTSVYTINGNSVKLNASGNINQVVKLTNITADNNGEILVSITSDVNSLFSYIGAIIIESANNVNPNSARVSTQRVKEEISNDLLLGESVEQRSSRIVMYPNPNVGSKPLNLSIIGNYDESLLTSIYDARGILVYEQRDYELGESAQIILNLQEHNLRAGLYIVKVSGDISGTRVERLLIE